MGEHAKFVSKVQERADGYCLLGRDTVEFGRNVYILLPPSSGRRYACTGVIF